MKKPGLFTKSALENHGLNGPTYAARMKAKPYPTDHTAIVGMVNEHGFAGVVRALAEQANRRYISNGHKQELKTIAALLGDCAEAIDKATN